MGKACVFFVISTAVADLETRKLVAFGEEMDFSLTLALRAVLGRTFVFLGPSQVKCNADNEQKSAHSENQCDIHGKELLCLMK